MLLKTRYNIKWKGFSLHCWHLLTIKSGGYSSGWLWDGVNHFLSSFPSHYHYHKHSKTFLLNMIWGCSIWPKIIHMCCASSLLIADSEFPCRWPSLFQNVNDKHHHSSKRKAFTLVTVLKCVRNRCSPSWSRLCHKGKPGLWRRPFFEQVICALERALHLPLKHHNDVGVLNYTTMFRSKAQSQPSSSSKAQPQPS